MRGSGTARTSPERTADRRPHTAVAVVLGACLLWCAPAHAAAAVTRDHGVYARVTATQVVLGNSVAERRWSRAALRTTALIDTRRGGARTPPPPPYRGADRQAPRRPRVVARAARLRARARRCGDRQRALPR